MAAQSLNGRPGLDPSMRRVATASQISNHAPSEKQERPLSQMNSTKASPRGITALKENKKDIKNRRPVASFKAPDRGKAADLSGTCEQLGDQSSDQTRQPGPSSKNFLPTGLKRNHDGISAPIDLPQNL